MASRAQKFWTNESFPLKLTLIWLLMVLNNSLNYIYIIWKGNLKYLFSPNMTSKALEIWYFYILDLVLVLRYLSLQQMSKFPDLSGFWEFPKDSKVIPIHVQNSQELGKFPASNNTVHQMNKHDTISLQYSQRHLRIVKSISPGNSEINIIEVKFEVSNSPF